MPLYLVAAFVKRLARLSLSAPPGEAAGPPMGGTRRRARPSTRPRKQSHIAPRRLPAQITVAFNGIVTPALLS